MDPVYENSSFILSTVSSGEGRSQYKDKSTKEQESVRKVTSPKWTKVLLIVLGLSLGLALGGLCALWMLYVSVSVQLSAKETNSKIMARELEELTANYTRVREQLSFFEGFTAHTLNCDVSLTAFHGKVYFFSCDKLNWSHSRAFCVSKGADLVTISSQTEQSILVSKIKEAHWIGLNDLETEGHWVWVNNQTLNETGVQFWHLRKSGKSEPDNWKKEDPTGENCASVQNMDNNLNSWLDGSCKQQKKFICEIK